MKIRNGFVSNSSSSSFVLNTNNLTVKQLRRFKEYFASDKLNIDGWSITEDEEKGTIEGYTIMDNDELREWLKENLPEVLAVIEIEDL